VAQLVCWLARGIFWPSAGACPAGRPALILLIGAAENPLADIGAIRRDNMMLIMEDGHMVKNEF